MYHLAAKRTEKTSQRKREREFFETQKNHACAGGQAFIAYLLLKTWEDRHCELCSSRLSGLV